MALLSAPKRRRLEVSVSKMRSERFGPIFSSDENVFLAYKLESIVERRESVADVGGKAKA